MTPPKVSILTPVYKVSDFIERCAHSLFQQSFKDIEFVFVNDCTTDDSIEKLQKVIDQYPERKNHVKIIHHTVNRGLAFSRNTAIDNSTGEYISIIDSDDFIEPTMIEVLYNKAIDENADIVVSNFFIEFKNEIIIKTDNIDDSQNNNFARIIKQEQTYSCLWNKLVKRELYERADCRVPEGLNYSEDRHVMSRLYYFAKKIVKVELPFYHYVQYNTNAITKNRGRMHFENLVLFWKLFDEFLIKQCIYENYKEDIEFSKVEGKIRLLMETKSYNLRKEFAHIFQEEERKQISKFKIGERLMLFFLRHNQFLLAHILHLALVLKNR